jgi:hypothetical protein
MIRLCASIEYATENAIGWHSPMTPALRQALAPVVSALEADGYGAVVEEGSGIIYFRVTAGRNACEDCLSPRTIMEPMISHVLRTAGFAQRLELKYPGPEPH